MSERNAAPRADVRKSARGADDEDRRRGLAGRIFGRSYTRTLLGLVVASIVVGAAFSFVGLDPQEFWSGVFRFFRDLVAYLGDSIGDVLLTLSTYLLIGAAIVIPIWLIARLFGAGRR